MATNIKKKSPHLLSAWQTETVRLTIFHEGEEPKNPLNDCWEALMGFPCSDEISKHQERVKLVNGPFEDGLLSLISQERRNLFEVRWQASPDHANADSVYPSIGDFDATLVVFNKLAKKVIKERFISKIVRIAFGGVIFLHAKDKDAAAKDIANYLTRITLDPKRSRDIIFRVNDPRDSSVGINGLTVNRINTWSLVAMKFLSVNAQPVQDVGQDSHFTRLELDINTCREHNRVLPKPKVQKIYDELVQMGREIVLEGSIP